MCRPALQSVRLRAISVFAADASARGTEWAPGRAADVPGWHLLRAGYALIAREPLLELAVRPPRPGPSPAGTVAHND